MTRKAFDVAVIGAGVFGAWTAQRLQEKGRKVVLLDAYGPGNSHASSGGESRIIRMGYGPDELYTRWSQRSLTLWEDFFRRIGRPFFQRTGVLWMARDEDPRTLATLGVLRTVGVRYERLGRSELQARYPQIDFGPVTWAILEPDSGVIMARQAVQALADDVVRAGADLRRGAVRPPGGRGRLETVTTSSGEKIDADAFVFACGPWLPKLFPELLGDRIFPTRQEVFFFGTPAGDLRFASPAMPTWIDFGEEIYGMPDLDGRGIKVSPDRHGPAFDPDSGSRMVTDEGLAAAREFVARRFPALKGAPLLEARVCQYENTSNGDFLIDRHPDFDNVWLVGGGSGHGFKHGPAVGEYAAARLTDGGTPEPRFSLATKERQQKRAIF